MRNVRKIFLLVGCSLSTLAIMKGAIMSSETRVDKLNTYKAKLAVEVRPVDRELLMVASSPFVPSLGHVVVVEKEEEVVLTDAELLAALSEYVNPTGIFMFNGEFYLIFKEKKLENGSEMGITFNGKEYYVTISEITGSTYTVRRGDAELQLKLK